MVTLQESLFKEETLTVQSPEGKFTNEFIIPWTKIEVPKPMQRITRSKSNVLQNFIPGTEWHYVKIYCGSKTSDKILTEVIKPMADDLLDEKIISKWFFIRYGDPDHHLRIRFKGVGSFFQEVTKNLNERLSHYLQNGHVWKVQADTYKRELDRYGYENIEASESLFFYDSAATSEILQLLDGDEGDSVRWQFAIKGVHELLNDFGYSLKQKEELASLFRDGFAKEFNATSRESQKRLSDHYRHFRKQIEVALQPEISNDHDFAPIWKIFMRRSELLMPIIHEIKEHSRENTNTKLVDLIGSYIHMFVNRFMRSNQRMHEMVIYDFLCQHYKSEIAKQKKSITNKQEPADLPVPV
jgi:thiopeptide-type bacteriocin biosynthesis protein